MISSWISDDVFFHPRFLAGVFFYKLIMRYRLTLLDKKGESIHTGAYESEDEAFTALKQFDLLKFQVTLERLDDAKS